MGMDAFSPNLGEYVSIDASNKRKKPPFSLPCRFAPSLTDGRLVAYPISPKMIARLNPRISVVVGLSSVSDLVNCPYSFGALPTSPPFVCWIPAFD